MVNMYTTLRRTRAWTWLAALLILAATTAQAQVGNYVANRVSRAFVPLTGDSTLNSDATSATDSWLSGFIAIPAFNYGGITYTRMYVTSNGLIQLANTNTSTVAAFSTSPGSLAAIIAPYGQDQVASVATGASPLISMRKFGTDSIVVQWRDYSRYTLTVANADRLTYQAILVYGTPGIVKFSYRIDRVGILGSGPTIGVSAGNATTNLFTMLLASYGVNNRESWDSPLQNNSNTAANSFVGSSHPFYFPPNNLSYTFVSAGTVQRPGAITTGAVTATSVPFSWTNVAAATSGYNWEARTSGLPGSGSSGRVGFGTLAAGATTTTVSGLQSNQRIVFYLQSNAGGNLSGWQQSNPATTTISTGATDVTLASIYLNSASSTGANFRWTAATTAPAGGYDWAVTPSSAGAGPFNGQVASGNTGAGVVTTSVTGLSANTQYYFWVRSRIDGANVRNWVGPFIFTTRCASTSALPVSEDMNTLTVSILAGANLYPSCWTALVANNGTVTAATGGTSTTGGSASGPGFNFPLSTATNVYSGWVFSPALSLTAGQTVNITYNGRATATTGTPSTRVWFGNAADPAAMTTAAGAAQALTATFTNYSYTFTATTAGTYVLGINTTLAGTASFNNVNYDDLSIINVVCGGPPNNLAASAITSSSATLTWANNAGATDGYEYALSTDGGTTWGTTQTLAAGATSVNLTGLATCTNYRFRIRSVCSGGTLQSAYNIVNFGTTGPVSLPWNENFDGMTALGAGLLPTCWTNIVVTGTGFATTSTSGFANSAPNRLFMTWSSNGAAVMPAMSLVAGTSYEISFQGRNADAIAGNFVMMKWNTTQSLTGSSRLATYTNTTTPNTVTASFQRFTVNFTPASSGTYYFIVQDSVPTSSPNGFSMDDFRVRVTPTCFEPTGLTYTPTAGTQGTASWGAATPVPGGGYYYKVVAGTGWHSAAAIGGNEGLTSSLNVALAGLLDGTQYRLWARSYCGPGTASTDSSDWTFITFTQQAPLAFSVTKDNQPFTSILTNPSAQSFASWSSTSTDDNFSAKTNIGFNFIYHGRNMGQFSLSTNGRLRLFGLTSTATAATAWNNLATANDSNYIMPLWDDLVIGRNTGGTTTLTDSAKWLLTGTAPNRTLTVEFTGAKFNGGVAFGRINYQVRLLETTNQIIFHYGNMQPFDFTTAANLLLTPTIALTGRSFSAPPTAGQALVMQHDNQNVWSHHGFSTTTDVGNNKRQDIPQCNDRYVFTPGAVAAWVPADTTLPSNDDPTSPIVIPALSQEPTNLCGLQFSNRYATQTDLSVYTTVTANNPATVGTGDDDVWFQFEAQSSSTDIKIVGSGGMRTVFQVYDAALNNITAGTILGTATLTGSSVVGTTSAFGQVVGLRMSTLNPGDQYLVRVYHFAGGTRARGTATVSGGAITGVSVAAGGSDYTYGSLGTGNAAPEVYVYGAGTGAKIDATITTGAVSSFTVRDGGSGYTTAPTVVVSRPGHSITGRFGLYVFSTPTPPANNNIATAAVLTPSVGRCATPTTGLTYAATPEPQAPRRNGGTAATNFTTAGNPDDDVWYRFTATDQVMGIDLASGTGLQAASFGIQILEAGTPIADTTQWIPRGTGTIASGASASYFLPANVGTTYFLRIYGAGAGDPGIAARFRICVYAQSILKYTMATTVGTFTPLTSPTVLKGDLSTSDTVGVSLSPPINFQGLSYDRAIVHSNGYVILGRNASIFTTSTTPITTVIGESVIAPFAATLRDGDGATGSVNHAYVGNEHVFEWLNARHTSATTGQRFSVQARVNTSTGVISFVYDSVSVGTITATTAQVGLRISSGNVAPYFVMSRTGFWRDNTTGVSTLTGVSPLGTTMAVSAVGGRFPAAGLTMTWTPTPVAGYPIFNGLVGAGPTVNYPTKNSARVRWMPAPPATSGYAIRWRRAVDPPSVATYATATNTGAGVNDTSYTITGLVPSTAYVFEVASRAGANRSLYSPAGSFTTLLADNDLAPVTVLVTGTACAGGTGNLTVNVRNSGTLAIPAGTTFDVSVDVTGAGTGTVTLTGFTLAAALAPNSVVAVPVGTYSFASIGTYVLTPTVTWTGDELPTNNTLTPGVDFTTVASVPFANYQEGFDTGIPANWTVTYTGTDIDNVVGFDSQLRVGSSFSTTFLPGISGNMLTYLGYDISVGNSANLTTPCFDVPNNCSFMSFDMAQTNSSSTALNGGIQVQVSVNGGAFTTIQVTDSITRALVGRAPAYSATSRWNRFSADLSAYVGQAIRLRFVFNADFFNNFGMDNVRLRQRPAVDLGITAVQSPEPAPSCASANTPLRVTLRNFGCNSQNNVPIEVTITRPAGHPRPSPETFQDTIVLGASLTSGQTADWFIRNEDLTTAGSYVIRARTIAAGDGDASNNEFGPYTVVVSTTNLPPAVTASITPSAVLVGSSANLTATGPTTGPVSFTSTPNALLPNAPGVSSTINCPLTGTVGANLVNVQVNIATTWIGDVTLTLTSPSGQTIQLFNARGGSGDDMINCTFQTGGAALSGGSAPFSGVFAPEQPFSNLTGSINGNWVLTGSDVATSDAATLLNWSITFNNGPVTYTWTANAGNPAPTPGFTANVFNGTSPGSRTFGTFGQYNYTVTSSFANGCSRTIPVQLLVTGGNIWKGQVAGGAWEDANNWYFGAFTPGSSVIIPDTGGQGVPANYNMPVINSNVNITNLTLGGPAATVSVGATRTFTIAGNVTGNLSQVQGSGTIAMAGTGTQTINGRVSVANLTVSNATNPGLTFAPGASLTVQPGGTLTMAANSRITVPAGASLVLGSSAAGTARLAPVPPSATFTGNLTMQRRTPTTQGWYFVSAPVRTGTLAQWNEIAPRVSPINNANIFEYTENDTTRRSANGTLIERDGWKVPSALTNLQNPTTPTFRVKGYRLWLNSAYVANFNSTLEVSGPPVTGNVTFPFTKTNNGFKFAGYNLAGNPYPSEIDFDAVITDAANISKPIGAFCQIWNSALGAYSLYQVGSGGTNGGSRYIPSSQAFWLRVPVGTSAPVSDVITFRESHKANQPNTFLRSALPANTMRMTLSANTRTDQALLSFRTYGLNGRDRFDADKMSGLYLNVSTVPDPAMNLVGNVMGELVGETTIPVRVTSTMTGTHTISFEGVDGFDAGTTVYLRDTYTNRMQDLNMNPSYSFDITSDPATFGTGRLQLVFAPASVTLTKPVVKAGISIWPNPAEGADQLNIRLANLGDGNAVVTLIDALGREVARTVGALDNGVLETRFRVAGLPAGVYVVRAKSASANLKEQVVIK